MSVTSPSNAAFALTEPSARTSCCPMLPSSTLVRPATFVPLSPQLTMSPWQRLSSVLPLHPEPFSCKGSPLSGGHCNLGSFTAQRITLRVALGQSLPLPEPPSAVKWRSQKYLPYGCSKASSMCFLSPGCWGRDGSYRSPCPRRMKQQKPRQAYTCSAAGIRQ